VPEVAVICGLAGYLALDGTSPRLAAAKGVNGFECAIGLLQRP
jgi:hypothetical protein